MARVLNGKLSPLMAGTLGLIPQCGFSVVATKLYSKRNIKLGTLLAVYIATSDEAIPIILSNPDQINKLWTLLLAKLAFAVLVGYSINLLLRKKNTVEVAKADEFVMKGCHHHEIGHCTNTTTAQDNNNDNIVNTTSDTSKIANRQKSNFDYKRFIIHPVLHTLTILLYILIVNLAFGFIIHFVGEDNISAFMEGSRYAQPFVAALIGLIPNCASSVLITQLYIVDGLTLGAAVAGLSVNAGVAFAVLFKENKNLKENVLIVAGLYVASVLVGLLLTII